MHEACFVIVTFSEQSSKKLWEHRLSICLLMYLTPLELSLLLSSLLHHNSLYSSHISVHVQPARDRAHVHPERLDGAGDLLRQHLRRLRRWFSCITVIPCTDTTQRSARGGGQRQDSRGRFRVRARELIGISFMQIQDED